MCVCVCVAVCVAVCVCVCGCACGAMLTTPGCSQDVERLQRSIQELYQMFQDLATLVSRQGEVLNSIETNVNTASKCVAAGLATCVVSTHVGVACAGT
mgnify:CR=1 FL=1